MDIEAFSQCIDFSKAMAPAARSNLEILLPVISSIGGVLIGFGINKTAEGFKTRKEKANKKSAVKEEVERIKKIAEQNFRGAISIVDAIMAQRKLHSFDLSPVIFFPCISDFFTQLSYEYTPIERNAIFTLISILGSLNSYLQLFSDPDKQPSGQFVLDAAAKNILICATSAYFLCKSFLNDETIEGLADILKMAAEIGIESTYVDAVRRHS